MSKGIIACVAALALLAATAAGASASPATFNLTGSATPSESAALTFKIGSAPTADRIVTCAPGSIVSQSASTSNAGSPASGFLTLSLTGFCVNGLGGSAVVELYPASQLLKGEKVGSVYSLSGNVTAQVQITTGSRFYQSKFGQAASYSAGWTNGTSVANPSTANFSNTAIGKVSNADSGFVGEPITLSGTIKLLSGGKLLTLN